MNPRLFFLTFGTIAALLTTSCASASETVTAVSFTEMAVFTIEPEAAEPDLAPAPEVQAIATSRGPDLEATDPSTVNLASGQLQLVEFFRFT